MNSKKSSFIAKLFKKTKKKLKPQVYNAREFGLFPHLFHEYARSVVSVLQSHGYQAYIVGGGVRDQLLDLHPKDFDVATNARPEEIKRCFERCLIIGKRFRLAHVYFTRRDFIEVATFREDHRFAKHHTDAVKRKGGIIARDNVFGDIESDAVRRDFSVNAIYYDPIKEQLLDFCGGIEDIQARILRLIGSPQARLQEDPVRILRALRIANKIGFEIDPMTLKAFPAAIPLLNSMAGGRLFDEYQKIFLHGQGEKNFRTLQSYSILGILFPSLPATLQDSTSEKMIVSALKNTDLRYASQKTINPAFLIAVFLWPVLQVQRQKWREELGSQKAFQEAVSLVLKEQAAVTNMPRYLLDVIQDVWRLQRPLELRRSNKILDLLHHPRYRAAYDFLVLRSQIKQVKPSVCEWWNRLYLMSDEARLEWISALKKA